MIVFCGKGGVGKTTLSLAFGLWSANKGLKTVVVSSHPLPELAVTVSLQGLKDQYPVAAANLFIVHIDPREELANQVRQQVPSPFLARAVLSSRIYQSLIEVAPGLKELVFLGRLGHLAERKSDERTSTEFDVLIWDAPATGHFLQTLMVSRNFDTYLSGPFALMGKEVFQFMATPGKVRFYPVSTLEEMAVEETIELCGRLERDLTLKPSGVVCNLTSPLLNSVDSEYEELTRRLLRENPHAAGFQFILDRHALERQLFQRLRAAISTALHIVERRGGCDSDLGLLMALAGVIGPRLGDACL
ncbi:MAG TPA: ArsA family ATPase [Acidobacteriota bacterium]|nr:ArsA family ATPase [Acidobacteriota bacterium]